MDRLAGAIENDRLPRRAVEAAETSAGASQVKIIGVADSAPAPPSAFKVYLTRVASLDTRQPANPQLVWKVVGRGSVPPQRVGDSTAMFSEMAVPGTSFSGTWNEHKFFENQDVARALGWRSVPEPAQIAQAVNEYASAQLEAHARYSDLTGLKALGASIERLKAELAAASVQPLTCLIALGWGTGFLAKTAFPNTEQEAYRKILRTLPAIGRAVRENLPFPKTRRIVFSGSNPSAIPGWVKLQLQD